MRFKKYVELLKRFTVIFYLDGACHLTYKLIANLFSSGFVTVVFQICLHHYILLRVFHKMYRITGNYIF
jgi:hypothetical protein